MKRAPRTRLDRWCTLAGCGLTSATLLAFLGRFFWAFDLFSHFRVQLFQAALILIGIAIWKRNDRQLILWVLLASINYAVILPLYFGEQSVATSDPVRAMLMNLYAENGNTDQVLNAIRTADPDFLVLEEVTPHWEEELSGLEYPYRFAKVRPDCFGILLMSKFPLSQTNIVYVGSAEVPTLTAVVHLPAGEISVIGTHPVPPVSREYSKDRNSQLRALAGLVSDQKQPVLLIGDLNVSPWSYHFSRLVSESGLKNSMRSFGIQSSWPVQHRLLRIPIDHVLHDPDIVIHNRRLGPDVGSDHFPVIVDFSLRAHEKESP